MLTLKSLKCLSAISVIGGYGQKDVAEYMVAARLNMHMYMYVYVYDDLSVSGCEDVG
jgi:hypothetical protein